MTAAWLLLGAKAAVVAVISAGLLWLGHTLWNWGNP